MFVKFGTFHAPLTDKENEVCRGGETVLLNQQSNPIGFRPVREKCLVRQTTLGISTGDYIYLVIPCISNKYQTVRRGYTISVPMEDNYVYDGVVWNEDLNKNLDKIVKESSK